jgi:chemotaxis-related protein WspD
MSAQLSVVNDCWNRVGVRGDRSCPELKTAIHCQNCNVFGAASQAFFDRPHLPDYKRDVTRLVAEPPSVRQTGTRPVVVFALSEELFALDTRSFVEVTGLRRVHRVAHRSNRIFSGLVSINGQLELCFSLANLLSVAAKNPDSIPSDAAPRRADARLVVIEDERNRRWVFHADRVLGVERMPEAAFSEPPATVASDTASHVSGVIVWNEKLIGHLALESIFASLERSLR